MANVRIQTGDKEPVEVLAVDTVRTPIVGLSNLYLKVRRRSDDKFLDWSDNTFKTAVSVVQLNQLLSEIDSSYEAGKYKLNNASHLNGFDTSILTNPIDHDIYFLTVTQIGSPQNAANMPQIGQISVGDYVDFIDASISDVATPAQVATEINNALVGYGLDHLVSVNPGAAPPATNTYIKQILDKLTAIPTYTVLMTLSYNQDFDRLDIIAWVEKSNLLFNVPVEMGTCTIAVFDKEGSLLFSEVDAVPDAQGVYKVEKTAPGLVVDSLYYATASILITSAPSGIVSGAKGMFTL